MTYLLVWLGLVDAVLSIVLVLIVITLSTITLASLLEFNQRVKLKR
jgi:hypothetical protein